MKILHDTRKSGKDKRWKGRKIQSLTIAEAFEVGGVPRRAEKIKGCGSQLNFIACPDEHERKLVGANFCRNAMCPMCMWRKGLLTAHQVCSVAHHALQQRPSLRFLFLTLTVPNVSGERLRDEITHLIASHRRLFQRKRVRTAVLGTFRAIEVTYNIEQDTYHPHFHILLAVPAHYFSGKYYIKRDEWLELWRACTRYPTITQLDIRTVKARQDREDSVYLAGAAGEIGKYVTKPSTICDERMTLKKRSEVVLTLQRALHKRRLRAYWGILKDIHKELKMSELENAKNQEMVEAGSTNTGCTCSVCGSEMIGEIYRWVSMQYIRTKVLEAHHFV